MSDHEDYDPEDPDDDALLCSMPHCDEPAGSACCTGVTHHYLCDACFCGYASPQFAPTGAFAQERTSNGIVSAPGELPCFLFLSNECNCASIPKVTLSRVLSTNETCLEEYENAKQRIFRAQYDEERQRDQARESQRRKNADPMQRLRLEVEDALNRGQYIDCPVCGRHGQKNDACMHMKCPYCGTRFCYCCGRQRGTGEGQCPSDGTGCDSPSAYLQNHPSYRNVQVGNESPGMGALQEFHMRRMTYLLREVKSNHGRELWERFRRQHPDILTGKPTDGRSILWDEIDTATAPLFGQTIEDDLTWRVEERDVEVDVERPRYEEEDELEGDNADDAADCALTGRPYVVVWIVSFILTIIMLIARGSTQSKVLRVITDILIAALVTTGLSFLSKLCVDKIASDNRGCLREVQCFRGRANELPYLATGGQWSEKRNVYWHCFFGGISLASVCMTYRDDSAGSYALGVFILTATLFFFSGLTLLVNYEELPRAEPLRSEFKHSMIRLCVHGLLFSLGVGLLTVHSQNAKIAGKVLFGLGFGGALSEIIPRVHQAMQGLAFASTPDDYRLFLSHVFFGGIAIFSLMVSLAASSSILHLVGGLLLTVSIVMPIMAVCCFIQNRPLVRVPGR